MVNSAQNWYFGCFKTTFGADFFFKNVAQEDISAQN